MKPDLRTEADIRQLVDAFYENMSDEKVIGSYFAGLDWSIHLPQMVRFWSAIAFGTGGFDGNPFAKHAALPGLDRRHFARWLRRFEVTVDARFSGPVAERLKAQAGFIGRNFQRRLGLLDPISGG